MRWLSKHYVWNNKEIAWATRPIFSGSKNENFQRGFIFPTKVIDVRGTVTSPQPEFRGHINKVEVRRIP